MVPPQFAQSASCRPRRACRKGNHDVDLANVSSLQFFDASNMSLGNYFVPSGVGANASQRPQTVVLQERSRVSPSGSPEMAMAGNGRHRKGCESVLHPVPPLSETKVNSIDAEGHYANLRCENFAGALL